MKASSLKEALPKCLDLGHFKGHVQHRGQHSTRVDKYAKCLEEGRRTNSCLNEWKCTLCLQSGHKRIDCEDTNSPDQSVTDTDVNNIPQTVESRAEKVKTQQSDTNSTKKPIQKQAQSGKSESRSTGQTSIQAFMTNLTETPNKNRKQNAAVSERSPPSPADYFRSPPKKNKTNPS